MIIQIKRFNHSNKINTKVNFPLTDLDLSNYIISKDNQKIKYDLFAVANHYGSLHYGHYTALCKNSIKNRWFEYNDSVITEINDVSKIISQNAYVLFYRQKGLSKLNWSEIYNKKFISIDINNLSTLIDFNYDFIKNCNNNVKSFNDNLDINEYDKIIKDAFISKEEEKSNKIIKKKSNEKKEKMIFENNKNRNNKNNVKDINNFLGKKRNIFDV